VRGPSGGGGASKAFSSESGMSIASGNSGALKGSESIGKTGFSGGFTTRSAVFGGSARMVATAGASRRGISLCNNRIAIVARSAAMLPAKVGVRKGVGRNFGPMAEMDANSTAHMKSPRNPAISASGREPVTPDRIRKKPQNAVTRMSAMVISTTRMDVTPEASGMEAPIMPCPCSYHGAARFQDSFAVSMRFDGH